MPSVRRFVVKTFIHIYYTIVLAETQYISL